VSNDWVIATHWAAVRQLVDRHLSPGEVEALVGSAPHTCRERALCGFREQLERTADADRAVADHLQALFEEEAIHGIVLFVGMLRRYPHVRSIADRK
jgi:hypothetical protein